MGSIYLMAAMSTSVLMSLMLVSLPFSTSSSLGAYGVQSNTTKLSAHISGIGLQATNNVSLIYEDWKTCANTALCSTKTATGVLTALKRGFSGHEYYVLVTNSGHREWEWIYQGHKTSGEAHQANNTCGKHMLVWRSTGNSQERNCSDALVTNFSLHGAKATRQVGLMIQLEAALFTMTKS